MLRLIVYRNLYTMIFIPVQVNISEFRVNNEKKIRTAFLLNPFFLQRSVVFKGSIPRVFNFPKFSLTSV